MPDLGAPSDGVLKSLALYWDEIVVPDSAYRFSPPIREEDLNDPPPRTTGIEELEAAGIVVRAEADVAAESLMPHPRLPNEDPDGELFMRVEKGDDGRWRFTQTLRINSEHIIKPSGGEAIGPETEGESPWLWHEVAASLFADTLMARARQCRQIAAANNLAPVSPSLLSHLASLTDETDDCPVAEGALLSVALEAFCVRPDADVESIVEFRDRNAMAVRRFRAAMTDLAATLGQSNLAPEAALAAARDIYRNRVEPDLGALESRLTESRLKFFARSLFGAAVLAVTPLTAPTAVEKAALLGAQTINYRFSRQRLLEEHPYSYLHRLSAADFVLPQKVTGPDLVAPDLPPREIVYREVDALFDPGSEAPREIPRYKLVHPDEPESPQE